MQKSFSLAVGSNLHPSFVLLSILVLPLYQSCKTTRACATKLLFRIYKKKDSVSCSSLLYQNIINVNNPSDYLAICIVQELNLYSSPCKVALMKICRRHAIGSCVTAATDVGNRFHIFLFSYYYYYYLLIEGNYDRFFF